MFRKGAMTLRLRDVARSVGCLGARRGYCCIEAVVIRESRLGGLVGCRMQIAGGWIGIWGRRCPASGWRSREWEGIRGMECGGSGSVFKGPGVATRQR